MLHTHVYIYIYIYTHSYIHLLISSIQCLLGSHSIHPRRRPIDRWSHRNSADPNLCLWDELLLGWING